jgi:ribosomal protein L37AE/L43A
MTSINDKMGLKRAGKRSMMKLPTDRELRSRITSARCPLCARTGATLSRVQPGTLFCTWCSHTWPLETE